MRFAAAPVRAFNLTCVASLVWCCTPAAAGPPSAESGGRWMGVASCASTACHNGNDPEKVKLSEFSIWNAHDKHARAYRILFGARSRRIASNLSAATKDRKERPAHEDTRCLKCHAMGDYGDDPRPLNVDPRFDLQDGVGCESCHGRAEKWLVEHTLPDFRKRDRAEKEKLGLLDTKTLSRRVAICAGCHVGNAEREVDHDLIAAGHPRLTFEFSGYHARYDKHWKPEEDRANYSDFEARAWLVGQVATGKSAVELLKARSVRAAAGDPRWPEFAEYGCYNCHSGLRVHKPSDPVPRWHLAEPKRRPGAMPWGTWYFSLSPKGWVANGSIDGLGELRFLMQQGSPNPRDVQAQADKVVASLDALLATIDPGPHGQPILPEKEIRQRRKVLLDEGLRRAKVLEWDDTAQLYLALSGLHADLPAKDPRRKVLRELAGWLHSAFPADYDSPRKYDSLRSDTRLEDFLNKLQANQGN